MNTKRLIYGCAAAGIAIVAAVVLITYRHAQQLDAAAEAAIATIPPHSLQQQPHDNNFTAASRKIISYVYNGAPLGNFSQVLGETTAPETTLDPEQISTIATPGVVLIINQLSGSIKMPDFDLDLANVKVVPLNKTYTEKVEAIASGSGFFINANGNLLTNAHVAGKDLAMDNFISKALIYYGTAIQQSLYTMSPEQLAYLEQSLKAKYGDDDEAAGQALGEDLKKIISDFITETATVSVTQKLVVLDPTASKVKIDTKEDVINLIKRSIPATVVKIQSDYTETHRDVALLKIEETKTPGLVLNADAAIHSGQKIFVFGFPSNATIDTADFQNSTMTEGSISAIKELDGAKVYQTDAKISPGSSGGPVLNEDGQVIGVMTYLTSGELGDGFALAIPIQFGVDMIEASLMPAEGSLYASNYISGVMLARQSLCRKANERFALANSTNPKFAAGAQVQQAITDCDAVIAAGNSLDSTWDKAKHELKNVPIYAWAGGATIMVIIIGAIFFLKRRRSAEVANMQPLIQG